MRFLFDYVSQELPGKDAELVYEHLHTCSACGELWKGYQRVIAWGRDLPTLPIPPRLLQRLRASAEKLHGESALSRERMGFCGQLQGE
jgi:predicted anti-sigma-YlaC factor YlaD